MFESLGKLTKFFFSLDVAGSCCQTIFGIAGGLIFVVSGLPLADPV